MSIARLRNCSASSNFFLLTAEARTLDDVILVTMCDLSSKLQVTEVVTSHNSQVSFPSSFSSPSSLLPALVLFERRSDHVKVDSSGSRGRSAPPWCLFSP